MDRRAERDGTISGFLTTAGWGSAARTALPGDASFRRYWRLTDGARRAVLMDAPPDKLDIHLFLAIDAHLRGLGYSAPDIFAANPATGLALLEDLGDATLAQRLVAGDDPDRIFGLAIDWVIDVHRRGASAIPAGLPAYDDERMLEEVERFLFWYVPAARGTPSTRTRGISSRRSGARCCPRPARCPTRWSIAISSSRICFCCRARA